MFMQQLSFASVITASLNRLLILAICGFLLSAGSAQAQYGNNVKIVSNCTELITELSNITGAAANNRFLIKLEPGKYECGTQSIVMRDWVDIEGSGVESTLIRGLGDVTYTVDGVTATALITGASDAELRDLSIKMKHTDEDMIGILSSGTASTRVTNVILDVVDGVNCWGILNNNHLPEPNDCSNVANPTVTSLPVLREVEVTAKGCSARSVGVDNRGRTVPEIRRSYIMGVNSETTNIGIHYNVRCVENNLKKAIRDVEASAYGVNDPDQAGCYGVAFVDSDIDQFQIFNSYLAADNCGDLQNGTNIGLHVGDFQVTLWNSQLKAKAGGDPLAIGMQVDGGIALVHNSTIRGDTHSVRADDGAIVQVGASQLRGSVDLLGASQATCAGVYDNTFSLFSGPACP